MWERGPSPRLSRRYVLYNFRVEIAAGRFGVLAFSSPLRKGEMS
jgi:hypothetical protein